MAAIWSDQLFLAMHPDLRNFDPNRLPATPRARVDPTPPAAIDAGERYGPNPPRAPVGLDS
jgi:hypothetical protein